MPGRSVPFTAQFITAGVRVHAWIKNIRAESQLQEAAEEDDYGEAVEMGGATQHT